MDITNKEIIKDLNQAIFHLAEEEQHKESGLRVQQSDQMTYETQQSQIKRYNNKAFDARSKALQILDDLNEELFSSQYLGRRRCWSSRVANQSETVIIHN